MQEGHLVGGPVMDSSHGHVIGGPVLDSNNGSYSCVHLPVMEWISRLYIASYGTYPTGQ